MDEDPKRCGGRLRRGESGSANQRLGRVAFAVVRMLCARRSMDAFVIAPCARVRISFPCKCAFLSPSDTVDTRSGFFLHSAFTVAKVERIRWVACAQRVEGNSCKHLTAGLQIPRYCAIDDMRSLLKRSTHHNSYNHTERRFVAVSYTHLTLPTKRIV